MLVLVPLSVLFIILCVLFGISRVLFFYYTNKVLPRTGNTIRSIGLVELGDLRESFPDTTKTT